MSLVSIQYFPLAREYVEPIGGLWGVTGVELALCFFFFSIFLPFWSQRVARVAIRAIETMDCLYHENMERDEIQLERLRFFLNYVMDLIRYVYGRGILFQLSMWWVFVLVLVLNFVFSVCF